MRRLPRVALLAGLLPAALLPAAPLRAQEPATASLDASRIGIEDQVTLTVSVPEERGGPPRLPTLDGFDVLGTQRVSQTSIVNGRMTRTTEWVYRLRPLRTGELLVPAVPVPGYAPTAPLRVEVESGSLRPAPSRRPFVSPFGSLFDPFNRPRLSEPAAPEIREEDLFIRAEAADSEVHVGEQVLVLYRLWSRLPVLVAAPAEMAQPEGFWSEEVELPDVPWQERGLDAAEVRARRARPGPRRDRRTVDGVDYDTYPLLLRAVFPTGAGERELPGPSFEIALRGERTSFFGPQRVVVARQAPSVTIRAVPLPENGRPAGFAGAVGDYELRAELLREEAPLGDRAAPAGEPLVLRLELEGTGNLRAAGTPALPEMRRAFRFFDPDTALETGLREESPALAYGGRRIWEFPMVPEAGGTQRIGAVTLDVFNPRTGSYERLSTDPLRVRVEGVAGALPAAGPVALERLGEDIRYLKPVGHGDSETPAPWRPGAFFLLSLTLPALWNLGAFLALRRRDYRAAHAAVFRRRNAARDALKALAGISGSGPEDASRMGGALAGYAAARLGGSPHGFTPEGAAAALVRAGAEPGTARRFAELLSRSEGARFAAGGGRAGLASDAEEARVLLRRLDEQLGKRGAAG